MTKQLCIGARGIVAGLLVLFLLHPEVSRCLAFTHGQGEPANAAVKYLRADASLRQSYALAPDATDKLEKALESPLDDEDEKIAAAAGDALVEFHHAAALRRCDWTMSVEDGPAANTAHRGAIRELAAVAGIRARLRFREGDAQGGISDALDAMVAARHLSLDGSLASVLFGYRVENEIRGVLATNLFRIDPARLRQLIRDLEELPSGSNLRAALESEKAGRNDFLAIAQKAKSRDQLIDGLLDGIPILQRDRKRAGEIVDGCGGSVQGFTNCISQQQSFYSSVVSYFSLPPERFEKMYKTQFDDQSKANSLIQKFTPNLARYRWVDAYCQTQRALLRAAIAVQLDGPRILDQYRDPYDNRPFSYVPVDGGFRLESHLTDKGTPLSLSIIPGS